MQLVRTLRWLQPACLGTLLALVPACGGGENGTDTRGGDDTGDAGVDHGVFDVGGDRAVDVGGDRAVDVGGDRAVDVGGDRAVDVADVADVADARIDLCVGVVCSAFDACHSIGACEPSTGRCSNPLAADGTACNDGNACTQSDTCQAGTCTGANPVTCTASDQCHAAGTCNPATGMCSNPNRADGTACNDGNACTQSDTCQAGSCNGANPVTCAASDQCHTAGVCNPGTGACSNPAAANGTACDDGNACTQSDTCQTGTCTGANPVTCTASDQCHAAGTCNPATGMCSNPAAANGTACNDGNACTQSDTCQAGACSGANPVVCTSAMQCRVGACNPVDGSCSFSIAANGTSCNDGLTCTSGDTCTAGTCEGRPPPAAIDQSQTSYDNGNLVFDGAQSFTPAVSGQMTALTLFKNGLSGTQSITLEVRLGSGIGGTLLYTGVHVLPDDTGPVTVTLSSMLNLTAGTVYTFRIIDQSETFTTLGQTGDPYARGAWVYDTAYGNFFIDQQFDLWFQITMLPSCP